MAKQHYFLRLIPPRPTFPHDMTDQERSLMQQHVVYMQAAFDQGKLLIYGPVMAPGDPFGMAVLEVDDEPEARRFMDDDPTVHGGLNRYALHPMRVAAARHLG
jgi:uncharacterized protein YciI